MEYTLTALPNCPTRWDHLIKTMVVANRDGVEEPGSFVPYYADQKDAEQRLPDLLLRQPVVEVFESMIQRRFRPVLLSFEQRQIIEIYFSVSSDPNPLDFGAA